MTKRRARGDGSVFQRARDGKWVAQLDLGYVGGKRVRPTFIGRTEREVREKLKRAVQAHENGLPVRDSTVRLDLYLARWLIEVIDSGSLAYKTKVFYRSNVEKHISPTLGRITLNKLKPVDIQLLLNSKREAKVGDRTIQAIHATLRRALNQAVKWEMIRSNPALKVTAPRPRRNADKIHAIDRDIVVALMKAAEGERLEAMVVLLPMLGLRKGELLGLRWSRVDLKHGIALIDTAVHREVGKGMVFSPLKTEASVRTVGLPSACVNVLRQHKARQAQERLKAGETWADLDLVFCTREGAVLDEKVPNTFVNRLLKKLNVDNERIHNFRHTAGTTAGHLAGGDLHTVQHLLGHNSIAVTADLYRHVMPGSVKRVGDAIGEYYSEVPAKRKSKKGSAPSGA